MNEQAQNLNQALLAAMDNYAKRTCFQVKQDRRYQNISYWRFQMLTFHMAKFFADQGITNGERVAIVADNCLEWIVAYVACLLSGGVAVPLRTTLAPDTLHFILQDSGTRLVILQNTEHVQALTTTLASEANDRLPDLKTIVAITNGGEVPPEVIPMDTLLVETAPLTPEIHQVIRAHAESMAPQAPASIIYVTSETGQPKGAVFEHAHGLDTTRHLAQWFSFEEDDLAFTVRPWSEATSLTATLHYFLSGIANALIESDDKVFENMQRTSPTVMLDIPYNWERFHEAYMNWIAQQPESSQEVIRWALAKGKEYRAAGSAASPELRQEYTRADMTFFSEFRGRIGGRMRRLYSSGASLPQELAEFFEAIGLPILNVYSLAEAGGFPAISQPGASRFGSCGQIAPGFEIRIADDGEIMVRGETVMREYWQRPEETRQAFDADGWFHSGDVGHFDEDGYLYVTSRKRHLMVLSTGRKIAPIPIENALTASPFITQAAIFGEDKPYVSAMIVPNLEALADHFQDDGEAVPTTGHPRVKALLDEVIGEINSRLDRWEQIREYQLLDQPLSRDAGELTPSMKISRHVVAERYAAQIEAMYPLSIQLEEKEVTQVEIDPERLRELLEKESILDAWMADAGIEFLFDLARARQIDASSMVHICDAAATIAQMENEEKPLSTALIVGDPARIARVLPESQVQLLYHDHIRRMRKTLVTLAKMVDGLVLGYVVDKYGYVRGVNKLEVTMDEPDNFLLGPQFRRHAAISRQCDAVVFFVPAGGRQVRVFADGQLVGRYANGDWSPDRVSQVDETMARLAEQKDYDLPLVQRVLHCAFQMSEENLGAIFLLGEANVILEHSDASEISSFAAIVSADIAHMADQELINFAKQDGATVIDVQGQFRGCMIQLRPGADTQAEIGPGKGARHSSAAKMSAEAQCLAITVSQDGPITVYDSGRRILSL